MDCAFSQDAFTGIITDTNVNIRSGAGVNFEILRKMNTGDIILVLKNELDWYKIKLPRNSKAYVHKKFITMDGKVYGYINANRVNIRAGHGTTFNVIGQLNKRDLIEVVDQNPAWAHIFTNSHAFAWVHKNFIKNHGPASIYTSKENLDQEAWKLLQQAKQFELSKDVISDKNEKRAACIQKYKAIIRDYPKSLAANNAKKHITKLSKKTTISKNIPKSVPNTVKLKITKKQVKVEKQAVKNKPLAKPVSQPIAQGKLIESGRFFSRPGSHKLRVKNKTKYYLKSQTIDLNTYIYHKVQIWGKIINSKKTKIPVIEVEYVNQLN